MVSKNVEDFYPLSPMQQGMLFHSLYAPQSGMYVEQTSCLLGGGLDVTAFQRAWQHVMDRHTILRTAFTGEGLKEPVQVVYRQVRLPLEVQDWRGQTPDEQRERLNACLRSDSRRGFELSEPPLMRLSLMQIDDAVYYFVWTYHHILLDGWSVPLLLQEVFAFYEAFCQGRTLSLERLRPYRDYIVWLRRQDLAEAEAFWRRTLQGFTAPTPLVVDRPLARDATAVLEPEKTGAERLPEYGEQEVRVPASLTAALQSMAREHQLTLNTLVQGAWALLLSRYSGEEDVLFGVTVSGRPHDLAGSESMIGLFINTLPMRVRVPPDAALIPWLKELQRQQVELRQYEYSPLVQIQAWSEVTRGVSLFDSILVFENYPVSMALSTQEGSLQIREVLSVEQTNYPLTLIAGADERLLLRLIYDAGRFDADAIGRIPGHLQTLLEGIVADPQQPIAVLPLLAADEQRQLWVEWNRTAMATPTGRCAHELFETQVALRPEAVAVTFEGQMLTYQELDRRANQLAHYLRQMGIGPESLVGISVERSLEMVVGIMGALKAGAGYLPIDPTYPRERVTFMLEDSQIPVLLTQRLLVDELPPHRAHVVQLDADWEAIGRQPAVKPESRVAPANVAYVIYTSGSTGRPKGTLLQHQGLSNLTAAQRWAFGIGAGSRVLQFSPLSFDASVWETFMALANGATLCLARQETLASGLDMVRLMQGQGITNVTLPPSVLSVLPAEELPGLQTIISAGEACTAEVITRWASGRDFFNAYGPTETTVCASMYPCKGDTQAPPIGKPIANTSLYVLDRNGQPVPVGVPGELCVGGVSLARGYLNRPELTASRFVPNPLAALRADSVATIVAGSRLYRTGDLVRYRADGNLEFLGRIDHQVKIRGFRIELGEIETVLTGHLAVREAVVLAREDGPGDKRLVAYVVPAQGCASSSQEDDDDIASGVVSELQDLIREKLPRYMMPYAIVPLKALPLTPNGKVDRAALPVPGRATMGSGRDFVAPRDSLELQLQGIWEEVLGTRPISVTDDFFELGGHSLLAVRVMAQIQQQLGTNIPLLELFQQSTIEGLAQLIRRATESAAADHGAMPSLSAIQPKGTRPPLFFVHPSGGSVHWYRDLAHYLGSDQPFYGFQAQGLNGDCALHTRIEDMAAHYVAELRSFQPEGPYRLGSWSMGVAVAFEMAQQLHRQGQKIALLALLDQGPFPLTEEPEDDAAYLLDTFGGHVPLSLEHLRQLMAPDQIQYVWEEARKVNWIHPDVSLDQFRHFVRLLKTHTEAWRRYRPQVFPGHITLLRAVQQPQNASQRPDMGWSEFAAGGVKVYSVDGDHLSLMMHKPHVRSLARQLRACLDAANDSGEE